MSITRIGEFRLVSSGLSYMHRCRPVLAELSCNDSVTILSANMSTYVSILNNEIEELYHSIICNISVS